MRVSHPYGSVLYETDELQRQAPVIARNVKKVVADSGADAIVVTGKSGIAMGFICSVLEGIPVVLVRKPGEDSHGSNIEGPNDFKVKTYVFLDDCIDSGDTLMRVVKAMGKRTKCVAIALYEDIDGPAFDEVEANGPYREKDYDMLPLYHV